MYDEEFKIYNLSSKEAIRKYIRENTNTLDGIQDEDIKQIETDYYNTIYVLLNNGDLYKEGKLQSKEIDSLWMLDGFHLFSIGTDNVVMPLQEFTSISRYLNNDDCRYKKIITNVLHFVGLTQDGKVRATTCDPTGFGIIPDNFINVDDIMFIDDQPHIIKNKQTILLYVGDMDEIFSPELNTYIYQAWWIKKGIL